MSYILEALKKAQAERQLGSAPTIHAPAASALPAAGANRKPLVIGFAAGVVLVALALMLWRHQGTPAPAATVAPAAAPPVVVREPAPPAQPAASPPGQVALVGKPDAAPNPVEREPVAAARPVVREAAAVARPPAAAPAPLASQPAPVAPQAATGEESLPAFGALPEATRRDIPKVAFGGYMYSPNPADRLILIDNVLRHEGEEVAPGLVLDKLLPKGAVMNYRGTRYRVPF